MVYGACKRQQRMLSPYLILLIDALSMNHSLAKAKCVALDLPPILCRFISLGSSRSGAWSGNFRVSGAPLSLDLDPQGATSVKQPFATPRARRKTVANERSGSLVEREHFRCASVNSCAYGGGTKEGCFLPCGLAIEIYRRGVFREQR